MAFYTVMIPPPGSGGARDEIERLLQVQIRCRACFEQRMSQLEHKASSAEIMPVIRELRIHQREAFRATEW